MAELKSTLKVFHEAELQGKEGHAKGHITKILVGDKECPSERIRVTLNTFEPGTQVPVHWHTVEKLYYCIAGRAVLKDVNGKTYEIGPGHSIFITPGIACAHGWDVKERLQLLSILATTTPERNIQFSVDPTTLKSYIEFNDLIKEAGATFKSLY